MSESQIPQSLFPQFTKEQLARASKSIKSSVNWTEYNKWVKAGKPFVEHDELMFIDQKRKNGSYRKPTEIELYNVERKEKQETGNSFQKSARKKIGNAGKKSNKNSFIERTQTTTCENSEYHSEASKSNQISDTIKLYKSNASKPAERQDF
ncbi:hypothetical protein RhiirA5_361275 [Rhizophagus irregularis]|uniref:Uncharacterized protein n=1 Tax=Rhizophagus irregularis TaxID=588596 RepID=A0A2N0PF92_9GLOM|nr:hypothetical protein RhiirA5_361275 [Rhizophagus irregularis]PKC60707.1 hypothetical protein RhiirA1_425604 [Rhizophagus irregularis]CAB5155640.1 unnamed protein product [Rhizophagus irregularis]